MLLDFNNSHLHWIPYLDIFFSERLTIVVTHYDRYFEGGKTNSIPKEEIQRIVASTIESEIGAKVSPKIVFPISGKWACKVSNIWLTCTSIYILFVYDMVYIYRTASNFRKGKVLSIPSVATNMWQKLNMKLYYACGLYACMFLQRIFSFLVIFLNSWKFIWQSLRLYSICVHGTYMHAYFKHYYRKRMLTTCTRA